MIWLWLYRRLDRTAIRIHRIARWAWKKGFRYHPLPPDRIDDTFDLAKWGKVQWPTRSVAHEIYTEAHLTWGEPQMYPFGCLVPTEEISAEEIRRLYPTLYPEGDEPCPPSK